MLYICCVLLLLISNILFAKEDCFVAKENYKIIIIQGNCDDKYPPQSTFKIPLSLMGFDSHILNNSLDPTWNLPQDKKANINVCKTPHNPKSWMRDSCVWYSQILTNKLGLNKFNSYIKQFTYGNMDVSGGINDAWLSSSLLISPNEQIEFLQNMLDKKFDISSTAYKETKKILFTQELAGGWQLYGKSGNGYLKDKRGNLTQLQHGWFIGFIEKNDKIIVFASHIVDSQEQDVYASFRAKDKALHKLWYLIDTLEN